MNIPTTIPLLELEEENKLTECDCKVIAAIIDCEGTIRVKKVTYKTGQGPSYQVVVGAKMTTEPIVSFLNTLCPGNTHYRKSHNEKHRGQYHWYLESLSKSRYLLEQISPFLMLKGNQAELCLDLLKLQREWGNYRTFPSTIRKRMEEIYYEVKRLNQRGTGGSS